MKRLILAGAALVVALSLGLTLVGAFLPRDHQAASEAVIDRSPDEVWAVLRDFARTPQWWPDVEQSTRVTDSPGQERWRQTLNGSPLEFDVIDDQPPRRLVTRVVSGDGSPFGGEWIYELTPAGSGTQVRLIEDGWVGPWPFRAVALLYGHHRSIESCLVSLGRHFGQVVTPTRVHAQQGGAARPSS